MRVSAYTKTQKRLLTGIVCTSLLIVLVLFLGTSWIQSLILGTGGYENTADIPDVQEADSSLTIDEKLQILQQLSSANVPEEINVSEQKDILSILKTSTPDDTQEEIPLEMKQDLQAN